MADNYSDIKKENLYFGSPQPSKQKAAELLAPAGSFEVFKAVLAAGADAVYLGGNRFGARAYAGNLSDEEILEAIDYAHIHGRKMYLTVNTLVKNSELTDLYDYIKPFYEAGLDAVIVQDYGVMRLISRCFPQLDIHASTQMTVTHEDYIDFLRGYNVTRIVPARELSLDEIRKLRKYDRDMELECFVHGALCYSYSGQCLISSFLGGRSGNRGRCAGTCRLMYEAKGNRRALLSLKDLCTLEILPDILEAGVYSLKIEGRMKSAEYAAGVTSVYRKYVDMYLQNGRDGYRVDESDIRNLLMLFDRGGMTKGYYFKHNGADMLADSDKSDKSQAQKTEYENFIKSQYVGKTLKEKIKVSVKLSGGKDAIMSLSDAEGNHVSVCGARAEKAESRPLSNEDIAKQINRFGNTDYEADCLEIEADDNIFMPNKALNELRRQAVLALNQARLAAYRRGQSEPFREFSEPAAKKYAKYPSDGAEAKNSAGSGFSPLVSVRAVTAEQARAAVRAGADRICVETELMGMEEIEEIRALCGENGISCFLAMPRIMREGKFSFIAENIENLRKLGFDGFIIRNMAEYEYLRKNGFEGKFAADYTMYAFNDEAVRALEECGFEGIVYPVELNAGELSGLYSPTERELIVYMRTPLMISANCIDRTLGACHAPDSRFGVFKDRKKAELKYFCCCRYCYNIIYNSVPTVLTDRVEEIKRLAPDYLGLAFADESAKQVESAVMAAKEGKPVAFAQTDASRGGFTRGHFSHGVE